MPETKPRPGEVWISASHMPEPYWACLICRDGEVVWIPHQRVGTPAPVLADINGKADEFRLVEKVADSLEDYYKKKLLAEVDDGTS